jgi:hypothetical protein
MNALLHIRAHGVHPNICMLRENFDEEDDYLLVLDLLDGGEMFEHLIKDIQKTYEFDSERWRRKG